MTIILEKEKAENYIAYLSKINNYAIETPDLEEEEIVKHKKEEKCLNNDEAYIEYDEDNDEHKEPLHVSNYANSNFVKFNNRNQRWTVYEDNIIKYCVASSPAHRKISYLVTRFKNRSEAAILGRLYRLGYGVKNGKIYEK